MINVSTLPGTPARWVEEKTMDRLRFLNCGGPAEPAFLKSLIEIDGERHARAISEG
jgi:hypothetical protein